MQTALDFNILTKREDNLWIAHCLELDIVASAKDLHQVMDDIHDLIKAQVDYAFSHNNLEHLYCPAPADVWKEFFACKFQVENRLPVQSEFPDRDTSAFVPPWIIAKTCSLEELPLA